VDARAYIRLRGPDRVRAAARDSAASGVSAGIPALRRALARPVSRIEREKVDWLLPGRIPLAAVTLLVGDPGLGKSLFTHTLAALVSRAGGNALIATAEDSPSATVRPRLEAAQADLDRICIVEMMAEDGYLDSLRLPDDVAELEALVREENARLLVVDPLMAHLPAEVNSWRDQSIRLALAPLRAIAERNGCAVLVVAHLNKSSSSDPLRRAGGSIGLSAAARSALLMAPNPDEPERQRVVAHWKCNVAELAPSKLYELDPILLPALNGFPGVETVRLVDRGTSQHDGEALLAERGDPEDRSALEDACAFLIDELDGGRREQVSTIRKRAAAAGISPRTLDRAKAKLRVKSEKESFGGVWTWSLPSQVRQLPVSNTHESTKDAKSAYMRSLAPLERR
jgi:putative DNA primase/helicase